MITCVLNSCVFNWGHDRVWIWFYSIACTGQAYLWEMQEWMKSVIETEKEKLRKKKENMSQFFTFRSYKLTHTHKKSHKPHILYCMFTVPHPGIKWQSRDCTIIRTNPTQRIQSFIWTDSRLSSPGQGQTAGLSSDTLKSFLSKILVAVLHILLTRL